MADPKLTEEIDGVEQAPQLPVTMRRKDGHPAVFPANMVDSMLKKGFTIAEPGEFTEQREANVIESFAAANAPEIRKNAMLAEAIATAVAKPKAGSKGKS